MTEAFASSIYNSNPVYDATKAIDGNYIGDYTGNIFHTECEANPWLQVELHEASVVSRVTIFNRADCCGDRFRNVEVRVGFTKFSEGDLSENELCATYAGPGQDGEVISIYCTEGIKGQYVSVQLMETECLNIAEVEIYGQPGNY